MLEFKYTGEFVGDPARECGGNGVCVRAARICRCVHGYAGPSSGTCEIGFEPARTGFGHSLACQRYTVPGAATHSRTLRGDANDPTAIALGTLGSALTALAAAAALVRKYHRQVRAFITKGASSDNQPAQADA